MPFEGKRKDQGTVESFDHHPQCFPTQKFSISYMDQISCAIPKFPLYNRTSAFSTVKHLEFMDISTTSLSGRFRDPWQEIPGLSTPFFSPYGKDSPIANLQTFSSRQGMWRNLSTLVKVWSLNYPENLPYKQCSLKNQGQICYPILYIEECISKTQLLPWLCQQFKIMHTYFPITSYLLLFKKNTSLEIFLEP